MNEGITRRHVFFLTALFMLGGITMIGKVHPLRDDWLIQFLLPLTALPLLWVFIRLAANGTPKSMAIRAAGPVPGGLVLAAVGLLALLVAVATMNMFLEYFEAVALIEIPRAIAAVAMAALSVYVALSRDVYVGRALAQVFAVLLTIFFIVMLVCVNQIDLANLLPIAEEGPGEMGRAIVVTLLVQAAPAMFVLAELGLTTDRRSMWSGAVVAVLVVSLVLGIDKVKSLGVLGYPYIDRFRFPTNSATSVLQLGELFQRFEFFTSAAVIICQPLKIAYSMKFAAGRLRDLAPGITRRPSILLVGAVVVIAALAVPQGFLLEQHPLYHRIMLAMMVALPVALLILLRLRERRRVRRVREESRQAGAEHTPNA